ncbi:TonB-dependent receptor [Phenylobacterium montanum]|uniref:TonB-dependent siderophore receptor n=1 Tax=Phenylobacterium montanum TaxID=2823693 RepID=A0A975G175_9CAUL|nr:TonB-dependent siderophore receptor [Caulobacter sp. S6]QUD89225.1 TonB-dependent siderophore receptor [Caulobacter sp. S6]
MPAQAAPSPRTRLRNRVRGGVGHTGVCLVSALSAAPALADAAKDMADAPAQSVVVTARKPTLTALSQKIQNTAQTINVLPQAVLHEQGVANLQEALKNVPGVTLNAGEGGAHGDTVNLRGFPANDDFFLDGLRDTGYYTRDSFDLEALEIYKGPASTLFGRGSTGGVINQVTKIPHLGESLGATLTGGTNSEARGTVDADYGIGDDAAVRLNAMGQRSAVAGRDRVLNRRWGVAPTAAIGLHGPTSLVVSYLHQEENNIPDAGVPYVGDAPAPVPHNADFGLPADDRTKADVDILTAKLTHDFSDALSVSEMVRYANYGFVSRITEPHYGVVFTASGSPTCTGSALQPAGTPLSQILVCRDRPSSQGVVRTAMSNTQLTYKTVTGPLSHSLILGLELDQESSHQVRFANQMSAIAPTSLLDPNPNEAFPGTQTTISSRSNVDTQTASALVGDTIDVGRFTLTGAVRFDRFHARALSGAERTDEIATPRASIVYKPANWASLYFSYGTSYDPSAENLSLSTTTAQLAPEKDRTYEVGAKAQVLHERLSLTAAAFDTEMTNARVTDPVSRAISLSGDLRARGIELGASGYLTKHWEILAGYTYLDAVTVSSTAAATAGTPSPVGHRLPNTARNQANLWTTYEFPNEIEVGAGVNYMGQRAADAGGLAYIPGYVTLDGMVSWQVTEHVGLQLNGYNLTDKFYYTNDYFSSAIENHVVPGAGRTVLVTATLKY